MSSFVIGLTGGIGSGKSTVAGIFASYSIEIMDADKIARHIIETDQTILNKIIEKFGSHVLDPQDHLNRSLLRDIIFADVNKRKWLEQLLHPLIYTEMQQQAKLASSPYCIQVIPLLAAPNPQQIQRILVVDTSESEQIKRTLARDKISSHQAQAILNAQISRQERLSIADDVIVNDGDLDNLKQQVEKLHKFYLEISSASLHKIPPPLRGGGSKGGRGVL